MRTSQALSYAVIILLLASSSSSHASVLEATCKSFGTGYDYCIKFFQADKDSATADKHGLAVIAIKIARAGAASALKRIPALKDADKDKKIQGPLTDCDTVYNVSINDFDEALRDIASGRIEDALMSLGYTTEIGNTCESRFREVGVKSPLAAEDSEFTWASYFVFSLTRILLQNQPPKV